MVDEEQSYTNMLWGQIANDVLSYNTEFSIKPIHRSIKGYKLGKAPKWRPKKQVTVVIPALNEESGIARTISEIPKEELFRKGYDCEILVVDGGSTDHTREIATKCGARVIVELRPGYGAAYKTGFAEAQGDIIVSLDADFSYPGFLIPKMIALLEQQQLDFVTTNRMNDSSRASIPQFHLIGNKLLTWLARLLFGVNIRDSQSGMWIFKKEILNKIKPSSCGMPFSEEIKVFAFRFLKSAEIPIPYRKRMGKAKLSTLLDGARNLTYLFTLSVSFNSFYRLLNLAKNIEPRAANTMLIAIPLWMPRNIAL